MSERERAELRDNLAGQALAGMCGGGAWPSPADAKEMARRAYVFADAMLSERLTAPAPVAPKEVCEGGLPDCGPVEHHDEDGVPLCQQCWNALPPADALDPVAPPATWQTAALLPERARQAIRDRVKAGEAQAAVAADYGVPDAFVSALVVWQIGAPPEHDPDCGFAMARAALSTPSAEWQAIGMSLRFNLSALQAIVPDEVTHTARCNGDDDSPCDCGGVNPRDIVTALLAQVVKALGGCAECVLAYPCEKHIPAPPAGPATEGK